MELIPVHPESVPGEPLQLRWVTPPGALPVRGDVSQAPGELGRLLSTGELAGMRVEPAAVLITLPEGGSWRELGPRVRTALTAALADADGWIVRQSGQNSADALSPEADRAAQVAYNDSDRELAWAAQCVIQGPAGEYVRSHGGHIELVQVQDGRVDVRLTGACGHCSGASSTLHTRVEADLRAACPQVVQVRQIEAEPSPGRKAPWPSLRRGSD
ncbi:NifU family protein [Gephyromycinifex aptenodytis]|uniref:NifU family protein n=1 Tax=Gephyromycinifex aptenodytis TaxID=2716227 RepID=UPI001B2FF560|nr:NifU family protein [Gephyromycinifex aptenodytis]